MEIVLKRIAKQNTYTIGRMYIPKDEEVERKVNYTLNYTRSAASAMW